MSEKDELISMGEKIISNFRKKLSQGGGLATWRKECALSCEILLDYLKDSPTDTEKALLLASIFQDKYINNKPPEIPHWCRKVTEHLSPNH